MPRPTNSDLARLATSGIRRFTALANETPGCVKLTLGEPEFDTPASVRAAVGDSLARGLTHYPPNNGRPELLEALSAYMAGQGLSYAPDELIVTVGATEALAATLLALLDPGDEVVVPVPAFGLSETLVRMAHGRVVALVPGTCFGAEGFVRLSYCVSDGDLALGLDRLGGFVARLRG